jgi:hypothetical protein
VFDRIAEDATTALFGIPFLFVAVPKDAGAWWDKAKNTHWESMGATAGVGTANICPSIRALGKVGTKLTLGMWDTL